MFSKIFNLFAILAIACVTQVVPVAAVTGSHGAVYSTATETVPANKVACVNIKTAGQRTRQCCGKKFFKDGATFTCFDSSSKKFHPINFISCKVVGSSGSCGDGKTNPKIDVKFDLSQPDTPGSVQNA